MLDVLTELVKLEHGAFIHIPDKNGYFPIDYAGMCGHWKCVALLARTLIANVERFIFTNSHQKPLAFDTI